MDREVHEFVENSVFLKLMEGNMITLNTGSNQILLRLTPNRQYLESEDNSIKVPVLKCRYKMVNVGVATGVDKKSLVSIKTNLYRITLVGGKTAFIIIFLRLPIAFDGLTMMLGKVQFQKKLQNKLMH